MKQDLFVSKNMENKWEIVDGHKYGKWSDINPDDYIYLEKHVGGSTFYRRINKQVVND